MREQGTIIVRRKSRHKGEGSHGGAWKVAFADFALAMMALFLVLWILSVSSEQERESVATKLRDYSVFEGSTSPYLLGGTPFPLDVQGQPLAQIPGQATELQDISLATEPLQSPADLHPGRVESEQDKRRLAILIGELARREGMEKNLELNIVPEGLRIRIHDQADKPMFTRGSARMEQHFEQLLHALAPVFEKVENRLVISGHTDSVRYASQHYSNWDLSGARAQNVRQLLELAGVPRNRVLQVVAMAEQAPFDAENPTAGHNRRVELLLLSQEAEKLLQTLFDAELPDGIFNKQQQSARVQTQAATVIQ